MAEQFHFEHSYAQTLFTLQAAIDQCREGLRRYAALPSAKREVIGQKSAHIESLDQAMRFLLEMTGAVPLEVYGQTERFLRQLGDDPQLTEGILRFRKGAAQATKTQPLYLTIETNRINLD